MTCAYTSPVVISSKAYTSPLAHKDSVQSYIKPLPDRDTQEILEGDFVNDAIKTHHHCYPRKIPIIPEYDPITDPESRKYFESDLVRGVIDVTLTDKEIPPKSSRSVNKLSTRRRCPPTPPPEVMRSLERGFTNDAIITEKQRTKLNDTLLIKYVGEQDRHCRSYHARPDVRDLLATTKFREFPVTTWRQRPLTPLAPKCGSMGSLKNSFSFYVSDKLTAHDESPYHPKFSPRKQKQDGGVPNNRGAITGRSLPEVPLAETPRINKLSYRKLTIPTPSVEKLRAREKQFVNDAVVTASKRTKYKDLIPKYDATFDDHARAYHKRKDVKTLVSVTCNVDKS